MPALRAAQIRICAAMMARPGGGILPPGRCKTRYNRFAPKRRKSFYPPVAKLDIAADSDSEGRGFESLRAGHNQNPVDLCRRDFGFFGSLGDTIRRPNTASRTISPLPAFLFLEKLPAGIRNVFKASQKTCCSLPVSPNGFLKLITSGELWARMNNAEKFERN